MERYYVIDVVESEFRERDQDSETSPCLVVLLVAVTVADTGLNVRR